RNSASRQIHCTFPKSARRKSSYLFIPIRPRPGSETALRLRPDAFERFVPQRFLPIFGGIDGDPAARQFSLIDVVDGERHRSFGGERNPKLVKAGAGFLDSNAGQ